MAFYEVIYESGAHSVMACEDEEEMLEGLTEHHRRALAGEVGGPHGGPAERVKRVLRYEDHPNQFNPDQVVPLSEVKALLKGNGAEVSVAELTASIRDLTHPIVESGPHESNYRMEEAEEISPDKWGGE